MAEVRAAEHIDLDWEQVARLVLISRKIDEIEEVELAPEGLVAYQFSARGHELAQVLLGQNLGGGRDAAGVYYRSRPFLLSCGLTPAEAFAADLARTRSPSEGRDVGVVYSLPPRRGVTVLPASGDVGAQYTPTVGWAQAIRYHSEQLEDPSWSGAVAAALGGDGSVATNGFWSALTIATTLKLPMLFFIEDNGYGISVPRWLQTPGGDIAANLESFENLFVLRGSGTEPVECADLVRQAIAHLRAGRGPCLLRLRVPRLTGHTYGEDQTAYKAGAEIRAEQAEDPLPQLAEYLSGRVEWEALAVEVDRLVRSGLAEAQEAPEPGPEQARSFLFYEGIPPLVPPPDAVPDQEVSVHTQPITQGPRVNMVDAIRQTLALELELNPRLLVFGEDVGQRGGVHRATLDLQRKFGEARVFDTSLSEEGIIGRATGMALAGLRPAPEIQFRKYADPAYEQIQDAGWVRWRTAGKFAAPMVVRIPVGYSRRTGDPWHSVCAEAIYAHTLGWRIAFPSNAADAAGLLREALRGHDPTLFLEHRALLDTPAGRRPYPGEEYTLPFGRAALVQEGRWLTVITWGEMVHRCWEAARPFEGQVEIIDLRTILPWDQAQVLASVRRTGKALVVHEDTLTGGVGAEIVAVLMEHAFTDLDAPVRRIATADCPIPYNRAMMNAVIPDVEQIRAGMAELLEW